MASANSAIPAEKTKPKYSKPGSPASLLAPGSTPAFGQPLDSNDPTGLQSLMILATGVSLWSATGNAGSPAASLNRTETPQEILGPFLDLSAGTGGQSAISANGATTSLNANTTAQIPATPAELLASLLSSAAPAAGASAPDSDKKTASNGASATASDLTSPSLQNTGLNAFTNAKAAFESLSSFSGPQSAFSAIQLLRDVREKLSGFAAKPEAAQLPASVNIPAARSVAANANDTTTLEGQRAISDARNTLSGQFEAKLQGALSASAPSAASGSASAAVNAHEGGNAASSQQGSTPSNSQDADQRKSSGNGAGGFSGTENSVISTSSSDNAQLLKASGILADAAGLPLHGASIAPSQAAGAAVSGVLDASAAASANIDSANSAKVNVPLPLPSPATQPGFSSDAVKASELYQRVDGSEMHVAMQTDLLGSIDLRATMHQSAFTATISVQRSDVQSLLANELPALQHALADRNLHVEQISIVNNSVSDGAGSDGQHPQQQNPDLAKSAAAGNSGGSRVSGPEDPAQERTSRLGDERNSSQGFGRLSIHV